MAKSDLRCLSVISSERLTPNMQRMVLGGADLEDFPADQASGYIKLVFPLVQGEPLPSPDEIDNGAPVQLRTYTVRAFDPIAPALTLDLVLHGGVACGGPASRWAETARVGDNMPIYGPGPKKLVDMTADWFLLAGDMTALPALSCNLEQMPGDAQGYAVIEINSDDDRQALSKPPGIELVWVVNSAPDTENTMLADAVRNLPWREGRPSIWAACEFSNMRLLRSYFKKERLVSRNDLYVSSYWKAGHSEDEHKVAKQRDALAHAAEE
ncbi:siderophore-interacting protein [Spongiibacter taiwanensis]|uniref:siderophore-interacting protein n=1 Tax=Spongiibacter taiwanensis TaxID=1748242 RepID=UPI002034DDAC|nr:siderophore-interacting protein [Spongiibacter taiwanensis]USA42690.1 siderophore-interacting protein [Spongiibacter taiwanensis]